MCAAQVSALTNNQDFIADALSRWHQSQLPAAAAVAAPATITATTNTSSSSTGIRPGSAGAVVSAGTSTNTTPARKIVENFSSAGLQALRQLYAPEVRWRLNYSLAPNIAGPHDGIEATVCGLSPWWCRGGCRRFPPVHRVRFQFSAIPIDVLVVNCPACVVWGAESVCPYTCAVYLCAVYRTVRVQSRRVYQVLQAGQCHLRDLG